MAESRAFHFVLFITFWYTNMYIMRWHLSNMNVTRRIYQVFFTRSNMLRTEKLANGALVTLTSARVLYVVSSLRSYFTQYPYHTPGTGTCLMIGCLWCLLFGTGIDLFVHHGWANTTGDYCRYRPYKPARILQNQLASVPLFSRIHALCNSISNHCLYFHRVFPDQQSWI